MKKVFEFKSSARGFDRQNRSASSSCKETDTRRRLFRQPKSCPHFSNRIEKQLSSEEASYPFHYLKRHPKAIDIENLLRRVAAFTGDEFLYLNYAVPIESEFFTPYSFQEVHYANIDRQKYFTISRHGFTKWSKPECLFTPLQVWIAEFRKYSLIAKVKIYSTYRLWKSFRKWSKLIKRQKFIRNRNAISAILFHAQPRMSESTVRFRRVSEDLQRIRLFDDVDCGDSVWALQDLVDHQNRKYQEVGRVIKEFYDQTSESIDTAATALLRSKGFSIEVCEVGMSAMKFMDRLKKKRLCKLVCRYLRYIDYITMNLLYELVLLGSQNFLDTIEQCNTSSLDEENGSPAAAAALLCIKISLHEQRISISPSQDEVVDSLMEMIDQSLEVVKVKRFEENELFDKFTRAIIGGCREMLTDTETILDIENYFCVDNRLTSNRSRIISLVNDSFANLSNYLGRFKNCLLLYSTDLQTNFADLEQLSNVQELRRFCERYTGQMRDIKEIASFKNFGIFELDQRCFDQAMTPLYVRLYGKICTHLPVLLSHLLTEANEICQEIMGTLLTPPEGTVGFVDYLYFIDRCESVFMEVTDKLSTVDELLELITSYEIDAGEDLWKRFKTSSEFLVNCKDAHSKKLNQKGAFIEKLSANIDKDVYQVYTEVTETKAEITREWVLSEDSQPALVKETLTNALEQLQSANERLVQLQSYCEAMDLELIDLSIFVEVQMDARVRLNLWESLEEWTNYIQEWYTQNFYQLNIDQMRVINKKILENCLVFGSALPENPISPKLEASVELFKGKIDIISQLRNETLKERHWGVIEELVDRKIVDNETITIKDFEEVGVFDEGIARKLVEISAQARAEQQLEEQLSRIECFWMEFHLKLERYRYHRNVFVLTNVGEVGMHLDDAFVRMNVIRSSEYVEPIRERVEKWILHLNVSTETLSEWSVCQTNWSRLEYLFSLPGIEFKVPHELRLFKEIHSVWRETMCEVNENSLALVALLRSGRLQTFRECNQKIQALSDRMDNYLNTRRLNYPRLYFLSDFELMTILTEEPRNVQQVGRFMPKIFDSIFKLTIKRRDIKCLLEPVYSITHMISETGQEVPLVDEVKIDGSTDQWLKVLEMEMTNTVRRAMKTGYRSYDPEAVVEWGRDKLPQVNLVINRLKIFQLVEAYHQSPNEEIEAALDNLIRDLKEEMHSFQEGKKCSTITSLLYNVIYFKDILQRIKSRSLDPSSFSKIWRYIWKHESPTLSIDGTEIPYFNEFISRGEDYLFSPATERTFLHFQRTISAGLNNLVGGPKAVGKTSTIRMFAKLVAKFTITFECHEMNCSYSDFQRILFGIVQTGCWCIFKSLEQVSKEILSVIGDQLMLIKEAKLAQRKEIELTGKEIKFNSWSQFFLISNSFERVPESFKIYLREIKIELPDFEVKEGITNESGDSRSEARGRSPEIDFRDHIFSRIITVLYGPPGSGKTKLWKDFVVQYNSDQSDQVTVKQMFVNSIPVKQLYGHYDSNGKWREGFLEKTFHKFYEANQVTGRLLIILDGDLKDDWMNILRGINERRRFVTLPNLALLRIPERVSFVIEAGHSFHRDLIKDCKFIHSISVRGKSPEDPKSYFEDLLKKESTEPNHLNDLLLLFDKYFQSLFDCIKTSESHSYQPITTKIEVLVHVITEQLRNEDPRDAAEKMFIFSILWTFGGALSSSDKHKFEKIFREIIPSDLRPQVPLWDIFYCTDSKSFRQFNELVSNVTINPLNISMDTTMPTLESTRMGFLLKLFSKSTPVLLFCPNRDQSLEISKSVEKYDQELQIRISQIFLCPFKSSESVQRELERVLIPRRKQSIGPVIKSRHIYIMGDIFGGGEADAEDISEFLRQLIETRGYFDRDTWNLIKLLDVSFVGVATKVAGSMWRLTKQCLILSPVMDTFEYFISHWQPILEKLTLDLPGEVKEALVGLLPIITKLWKLLEEKYPNKYSFFDMKRILVGILQPKTLSTLSCAEKVIQILQYEVERVLCDSNGSSEEREEITNQCKRVCEDTLSISADVQEFILFGNFIRKEPSDRVYEEVTDSEKLKLVLCEYLEEYNKQFGTTHDLFWHNHLLTNLTRICGLIRNPHFHGCVVGGVAKKIISKLSAFINNFHLIEIKAETDIQSKLSSLREKKSSERLLLLLTNVKDIECLKSIVELLDNGSPSSLLFPSNSSQSQDISIKSRINILLLFDTEELANSVLNQFATLRRWCLKYILPSWSSEEYKFIAMQTFDKLELDPKDSRDPLAQLAVHIHLDCETGPLKPPSFSRTFLHLMQLYEKLWKHQKAVLEEKLIKIKSCKQKLSGIKEKLASEDLKKFLPQLEDRKGTLKEMRIRLEHMVTNCEEIRAQVVLDESSVRIQTASTAEITDDVNKDLEIAMPALRAAQDQVKSLSKGDWNELKGQNNPVKLVVFVHEAVCILFKLKPDWPTARALINDPNILNKVLDFDKENVSEMVTKKIKAYIESKDFDPAKIEKVSKVSKCLCLWVKAIDQFAKVYKIVEPKVRKQQNAESALRESMVELRRKQQELADAESKIQILRDKIEEYNSSFQVLQENVDLINLRLTRANRVTTSLAEEDLAWTEDILKMEEQLESLSTDVLLTSAAVVYLGQFREGERIRYLTEWKNYGRELELKMSEDCTVSKLLVDDLTVLKWQSLGLPKDIISIENALIWRNSLRYPLIIDTHERMTYWILKIEPSLRVLHHRQRDFDQQLRECLEAGDRVLITEVSEPVNKFLAEILREIRVVKSGQTYLKMESLEVPFQPSFFMSLITKRDVKEFGDEFLTNLNAIDCEVSDEGNEEDILTSASDVELRALKSQTEEVQMKIEEDCQRMKTLQDAIVTFLHESKGNILDDAELVQALYETKETYSIVVDRLADTGESEKVLVGIKEKYRRVAELGKNLWAIVNELKGLDPLYSIPMKSFVECFASCVLKLEGENVAPEVNQKRIQEISKSAVRVVFERIQPNLRHEHQEWFARRIWSLLNEKEVDVDVNQLAQELDVSLFGPFDLNQFIRGTMNHHPLIILPQDNSLEELISELRSLKAATVHFIAVGEGNEEIVLRLLDDRYTSAEVHVLVLQNVHFNAKIVRHIEERFAQPQDEEEGVESGSGLLISNKLILVAEDSKGLPGSILYNSRVLTYYGNGGGESPEGQKYKTIRQ